MSVNSSHVTPFDPFTVSWSVNLSQIDPNSTFDPTSIGSYDVTYLHSLHKKWLFILRPFIFHPSNVCNGWSLPISKLSTSSVDYTLLRKAIHQRRLIWEIGAHDELPVGGWSAWVRCIDSYSENYSSCFCVDECIHNHCLWRKEQFQFYFWHLKNNSHWNTWRYFNWKKLNVLKRTNLIYKTMYNSVPQS